jgi:hypothetical protein
MMKSKLLFLIFFISLLSYGQQSNDVSLIWQDNVPSAVGNVSYSIPQFQPQYMQFDSSKKALLFISSLSVSSPVNQNSLQVTNIVYETISREQLGQLSATALPSSVNAKLQSSHARSEWFATLTLSPIIQEGGSYKRVKSFTYSYLPDTSSLAARTSNDVPAISNSVLSSGSWYRFYVEASGVYKVSKSFLRDLGFNVDTDPRLIKIYGNGGHMAPLLNSVDYPMDLAENAITFIGEEDGVFNDGDYILFYAEGVGYDRLNVENGTHNNLYANRSYYYVTADGGTGKRILPMVQPGGAPTVTVTSYDEYQYHEKDLVNFSRLGRKWHGEAFNIDNEQDFIFRIPDIEGPASITVSAAAKSANASSMTVKANGQALSTLTFNPINEAIIGSEDLKTGTYNGDGNITVTLTYNNGGVPGSNAWLDYVVVEAKRRLRGNGSQFRFRYNNAASSFGVAEYQVANAGGISEVWDITNIYDVTKAINPGQVQFSFKAAMGEARQYVAVVQGDYYNPLKEGQGRVANQNIKGTIFKNAQGQFQDIDYLIVTPAFLTGPAERLANMHRTQSNLNVKVISLESIYQEFGSGKQDIAAIRNFVKYVYYNASSPNNRVQYLNLFGDASYDFKDRIPNNTNIVPILHALSPLYNETTTFVSDEVFGLMDPNEGRIISDSEKLDIAVGRMPVSTVQQANEMVNKVIEYKNAESYGRWRNEYIVIADDVEDNGERFTREMDALAINLTTNKPFVNVRKIYTDAFVQQASAGGFRYPDAKEQIINAINYGSLVVNYLGHGGESGLASERIFESSDAQNLTNRFKYPLFITVTCDLTRFDNPYARTAGEYIYGNSTGGAIAMITTTRAIFTNTAYVFNDSLTSRLYAFGSNTYPSMAEALRLTKIALNVETRVISFIGDPALKLAIPKPKIVLTQINDNPVGPGADVLKSLSYVKLKGEVRDESGNAILNNYTGELAVTVFDKPIQRSTLNNDNGTMRIPDPSNPPATIEVPAIINFSTLGETIFRGNASVVNGRFEFGFVVPRDIRIPIAEGRVSFYAKRNNVLEDQSGNDNTIRIGGINENAEADTTPPRVRLYMNEESFVSGGITNESPIFLAFMEDEHGMNTASGIGHDMIAILDGDETNPYILNDYYETELDNYQKGKLRFPFANLSVGLHTLTFKAWDVYNNLITAEIQFMVVGDDEMRLEKVLNYPNPFVSYTEFWFTHNRPFEPLDVQVQIFTVTGKVVKTINQQITTDGFLSRDIKWDGKDDFGDRIGKGVYVYKLTVRSSTTNKRAEKYEKLVLL